jgi:redox-sensitive bicupin YhaK (pirin superfamily)
MSDTVIKVMPLGFVWETSDPFLFCVHHKDSYPKGNSEMGPASSLAGRNIGSDFELKDGWRMYHGDSVPGFPEHPHRGFETITIVLEGMVDHFDSSGASGRYGDGDVQWMTAGSGLQHSEMFPLVHEDKPNPLELFQIWINLPAKDKFVEPHYKMLWADDIPIIKKSDSKGKNSTIRLVTGSLDATVAPDPAPDSWACNRDNHVTIMIIDMDPGAQLTIPACSESADIMLYFFEGTSLQVNDTELSPYHAASLKPGSNMDITAGTGTTRILILKGNPIGEPVAQYGPFVMNTMKEIEEAYSDFQKTGFGGWPWNRRDPVNTAETGRHAKYSDGSVEEP